MTALDLADRPDGWIRKEMGVGGLKTVRELRGEDCIGFDDMPQPKQTTMVSRSFGTEVRDYDELANAIAMFATDAARSIRRANLVSTSVSVFIETNRFEIERLRTRNDELANMDDDGWTEELVEEAEGNEERLDEIEATIDARAVYRREDIAIAGCIATIGNDGELKLIQGLVRPEDMPAREAGDANMAGQDDTGDGESASSSIEAPTLADPHASSVDVEAEARKEAGVGIGLADDLRAIRTAIVKSQLACDFDAAFDLLLFQLARGVFTNGYHDDALDIRAAETPDRPAMRVNDDAFGTINVGEKHLEADPAPRVAWTDWHKAKEAGIEMPEPPAELRPWRPGIADTDYWDERSAFAGVGTDALVMQADPEPPEAQALHRALGLTGLQDGSERMLRLFAPEPRFEGYPWYDALARVTGIETLVTVDGAVRSLDSFLDREDSGELERPEDIAMHLNVLHPPKSPRHCFRKCDAIAVPADLAFAGEAWSSLHDVLPLVTADSGIAPEELARLLRAAFFSPSDDADADSWKTQLARFEEDALHMSLKLLCSVEEARQRTIADAVWREIFWLMPHAPS